MAAPITPISPIEQAQTSADTIAALPPAYQYQLENCEVAIAHHSYSRDELQRSLTMAKISTGVDTTLIVLGGFFGLRNFRIAEHEASFLRSVTGNPYIRRVFTPYPFVSVMCFLFGMFSLPVDLAALSIAKDRIALQHGAVQNGEAIREDIIREGLNVAAAENEGSIK